MITTYILIALSVLLAVLTIVLSLRFTAQKALLTSLQNQLQDLQLQSQQLGQEKEQLVQDNARAAATAAALQKEIDLLSRQLQEQREAERQAREADKQARASEQEQNMTLLREQVTNITQQLLKARSEELEGQNRQSISHIIDPLQKTIEEMKRAMEENKQQQVRNAASFEEQIKHLMASSAQMSDSANRLSTALTTDSSIQGHWGETVLKSILDAQGLVEGLNYEVQSTLRDAAGNVLRNDETGCMMRPDVVIHMDRQRDFIIDSKVSLTAFIACQNAQSEDEKKAALAEHLRSIRKHVKELAHKDYSRYVVAPRQAMNFVMMFVPHESALQLALYADANLWHEAMEQGVFIVGEQNLYAALRAVELTWTQIQQAENHQQVYQLANELLSRVGDFLERYHKIGETIDRLQRQYDDCEKKLTTGQSVLGSANKLIRLGAQQDKKHPLPTFENQELGIKNHDNTNVE